MQQKEGVMTVHPRAHLAGTGGRGCAHLQTAGQRAAAFDDGHCALGRDGFYKMTPHTALGPPACRTWARRGQLTSTYRD